MSNLLSNVDNYDIELGGKLIYRVCRYINDIYSHRWNKLKGNPQNVNTK